MNRCLMCDTEFKTKFKINGKYRNLGNRKYCLTCSPFGSGNRIKLERFKDTAGSQGKCEVCKSSLKGNSRKFCSFKCKQQKGKSNTQTNTYTYQQGRALQRKLEFVKLLGGCCEKCGYNKNLAALHFHHKDSAQKERNLDSRSLSNTNIKELEKEVNKCQLLCANCHAESHFTYLNLENGALSSLL